MSFKNQQRPFNFRRATKPLGQLFQEALQKAEGTLKFNGCPKDYSNIPSDPIIYIELLNSYLEPSFEIREGLKFQYSDSFMKTLIDHKRTLEKYIHERIINAYGDIQTLSEIVSNLKANCSPYITMAILRDYYDFYLPQLHSYVHDKGHILYDSALQFLVDNELSNPINTHLKDIYIPDYSNESMASVKLFDDLHPEPNPIAKRMLTYVCQHSALSPHVRKIVQTHLKFYYDQKKNIKLSKDLKKKDARASLSLHEVTILQLYILYVVNQELTNQPERDPASRKFPTFPKIVMKPLASIAKTQNHYLSPAKHSPDIEGVKSLIQRHFL